MKVFVLGSTGMLGRYVFTYLKTQRWNVIGLTRKEIDCLTVTGPELRSKLFHLGMRKDDVVINCMGVIKQQKGIKTLSYILVNTVFPLNLADICEAEGVHMIHPSTDCVYSGSRGKYSEIDIHDAMDVYGKSKSLGEPANATVIRTSIIGEELKGKLSFIEWVKSNQNKTVNGFRNWIWNGITCLEWAKICDELIRGGKYWLGAKNVFSYPVINKDDLVRLVSDVYELNITVNSMDCDEKSDRSLTSIYNELFIIVPPLKEQLENLQDYYETLKIDPEVVDQIEKVLQTVPNKTMNQPYKDIPPEEMEYCLHCGNPCGYPKTLHIEERPYFIEGAGPLCGSCYLDIYIKKSE